MRGINLERRPSGKNGTRLVVRMNIESKRINYTGCRGVATHGVREAVAQLVAKLPPELRPDDASVYEIVRRIEREASTC